MGVNVRMWGKALRVIPRLSREEWFKLDVIAKWLIATRSAVLVMTFLSAAIAGILALRDGHFNLLLWFLLTVGLIMAHATNNLVNDTVDYLKGVDKDNYFRTQYGPQPLEHGLMSIRQELTYAAITGLIAVAAGAYLLVLRGSLAWLFFGLGVLFVLFYTFPLKYIGLGELTVLVVWGPLMIGGGYYVITGGWDWNVVIAGLPYAIGVTVVLFGKHIDKIVADTAKRIRTVPVLLGERSARYVAMGLMLLQYLLVIYLVAIGFFSPVMLIVLLALPTLRMVVTAYRSPRPTEKPDLFPAEVWPMWFVPFAFLHNKRFGIWFLLGLIAEVALHRFGILV